MASADGHPSDLLSERAAPVLRAAPHASFFAVVALLERLTPDRARVGGDGPPSAEAIRFRHDPALAFSAGDVSEARMRSFTAADAPGGHARPGFELVTTFLGLTGAISPLPSFIPEEVLHEDPQDPVQRDFLDIFHHRLVSLLYRSVSRYSPAREHSAAERDPWVERALALAGIYPEGPFARSGLPAPLLLRLVPLLAQRARSARTLELALGCALAEWLEPTGAEVRVELFAGGYQPIEADQRTRLRRANHALGRTARLGRRAHDCTSRFAIHVGPLGRTAYAPFVGRGEPLERLRLVVGLVCREPLDYDVVLESTADAAEPFHLGSRHGVRLGTSTRLSRRPAPQKAVIRASTSG